ncbi:MAG TPA: thiamine pyrophosphate-binding protein [Ilumatobacteraceae bacterium]
MDLTIGEQLDRFLRNAGITAAFGVPGGQTLPLYGAAADSGRMHVVMRDERNAACAADAYARVNGTIGVCDATVGPGVTNLVSGLAEAYASGIPVVALVADIRRSAEHLRERGVASQAASQREMLAPVSKWIARIEQPRMLARMVEHAVRVAVTGRPGPVVIEIPEDVFLGNAESATPPDVTVDDTRFPRFRSAPAPAALDAALALLSTAERPIVIAGGGVTLTGAAAAVCSLAERTGIPIATTINGKGTIDERHPLAIGVIGIFGTPYANDVVRRADVIVAIGTKFDQLSTHAWRLILDDQRLVHVDADGEELGRTRRVDVPVLADALEFATAALARLAQAGYRAPEWVAAVPRTAAPGTSGDDPSIGPEHVVQALDRHLDAGDLLVSDASLSSGWAAAHYRVKSSGVGMLAPRGLAGIGWMPGAAIGARLAASDDRKVVGIAGDGAWAYGLAEVETATRYALDLVFVVLNNSHLGWIKHAADEMGFRANVGFGDVDFAAAARAMGACGAVVSRPDDLDDALRAAIGSGGVHVIDVRTSAESSPTTKISRHRTGPYA